MNFFGFFEAALKMMFCAARKHPKECKATREDIDLKLVRTIKEWKNA